MDWLPLGIGLFAAAMLVSGLVSGRMPSAVMEPSRADNPLGFWCLAVIYGAIAIGGAGLAVRGFL